MTHKFRVWQAEVILYRRRSVLVRSCETQHNNYFVTLRRASTAVLA